MNELYKINYSNEAITELDNIYNYISYNLYEPNIANGQIERIRKTIHSLNYMPEKYVRIEVKNLEYDNVRKVTVDNYVIYYAVDNKNKSVTIVHIFYGGRNTENIL